MKKRLGIGLVSNIISILIAVGLNFIITPYIISKLGSTAYGFDTLSDNIASYATVITTALNYMGCRFIAYAYHQGKRQKAESFFSSLFFGDLLLAVVLGIGLGAIVVYLDKLITIPEELLTDVKITFLLTFLCFLLRVIETAFTAGAYVAQRMDLYAVRQIIYNIIRAVLIVVLYIFLKPQIYYISLATCLATIVNVIMDYSLTRKLLPDLKIRLRDFKGKCIAGLISSGVWYSIISLGGILANGLDLLITNQFISPYYMGILAVSKTVTSAISKIRSSIVSVFNPNLLKNYADGKEVLLGEQVKVSMRITSFILNVPLACLAVYGNIFYKIWLPNYTNEEIRIVTILTVLGMSALVVNANMGCVGEICALVNKLKLATLANLIQNALSLILTLFILEKTNLSVFAVAGVSSIVSIVYFVIFVVPYMAKLLKLKYTYFFPTMLRGTFNFSFLVIVYYIIMLKVDVKGWIDFIILILCSALVGYIISFIFCIKKEERRKLFDWKETK